MKDKSSVVLAIVVPCYNESACINETANKLADILNDLLSKNLISKSSYILFVNDGSTDTTWEKILDLHLINKNVCGVNLAGNVGHQSALFAGLSVAVNNSDILISIDADLQDDVNVIPEMISKYHEGYDIVYGVRQERKTDTFLKRITALTFYKIMNKLGVKSIYNHADYRLMSNRAVTQLLKFRERNLFLRGMVPLIGYNTSCVYYNRSMRFAGVSKYPFSKMLNFAIEGITSFSVKPVRFVFFLGIFSILIAIFMFMYIIFSYIFGNVVSGWSSLMISLWFIGGMILLSMGIIGEYIGKIYIEVKDRPRYNIESVILNEIDSLVK